jgi:hypothetical protein
VHWLILITITVVTQTANLVELRVLPTAFKLLPELMSVVLAVLLVLSGLRHGFRNIATKYWLIFAALILVLLCGALANSEAPGPIVNGARMYLRAAPLFLVSALFTFTLPQIRQQLWWITLIALLQAPIAVYQRTTMVAAGRQTGDLTYGTLMNSGIMTVFLVSVICIAAAFTVRGRLLVAVAVNETKATVVLLPVGLLTAVYFGSPPARRGSMVAIAAVMLALMGTVFVPLYDYFARVNDPEAYVLSDYIFKDKVLQEYLETDAGIGSRREAGRIDAIVVPFHEVARDPVSLVFGFGLGNASNSSLGVAFSGAYDSVYNRYVITTSVATFMLEIGLLGCAIIALFSWFVLRDTLAVARADHGLVGTLAAGWVAVVVISVVGLFYLTLHTYESLAYLYVYFSGMLAAQRVRIAGQDAEVPAITRS